MNVWLLVGVVNSNNSFGEHPNIGRVLTAGHRGDLLLLVVYLGILQVVEDRSEKNDIKVLKMRMNKKRRVFLIFGVLFLGLMLYVDFVAKHVPGYWWMIRDGVALSMVILFAYGYPNHPD
jgi:hypothetical protein